MNTQIISTYFYFNFLGTLDAKDRQAQLQLFCIEKTAEIPCPPIHLCQAKQPKMALQNPDLTVLVQNPVFPGLTVPVQNLDFPVLTPVDPVLAIRLTVGDTATLQCL